jgi:hypothetical protein
MAESVAELLGRLRIVGGPVESLYLNETRVHENFIGQLGAIESFTRTATKKGTAQAGIPVINVGGELSSEAGVTWTLSDPIAQALVLRAALESQGLLSGPDGAAPGCYISFAGKAAISRPGVLDDLQQKRLKEHPGLYEALEAERATVEHISRMTEGPESNIWLLTISEGPSVCAAAFDQRWLRPAWRYWGANSVLPWRSSRLLWRLHETGVPLLAPLHVSIKWQTKLRQTSV